MGFQLPGFLDYDLFKGTRQGFWFGSNLTETGFVILSVTGSVGPLLYLHLIWHTPWQKQNH